MSVMKLEDVKKIYKMGEIEVHALRDISFEIEDGDYIVIVGPSGSGKSTLLQILGCLDRPTLGNVYIENSEVSSMPDKKLAEVRNKKIGFIFQKFNLLSHLSALENVELPMIYGNVPTKERKKRAKEYLELVGLGDRMDHKPTELSGGQQQRVAIARGLANEPAFLLADEPTGNLDSKSGKEILQIFQKLNDMGKTLVVVTHDPTMESIGNKVVRILDGAIESIEVKKNGNT
ncbi:ABC transporter ATP-binding protein [Oceanotoga sp. DSM 15011]|uniref:ABC transport system ATP-binding protein n=2 Tax=Petrotogaceae TaxID=1643949 RepID=A0AA45C4W9_9BACT|nr:MULTISPECIES: ABC transporter ATP-binding protein [Oceanotoga]MDN5341346.1 putative transport system ATP-binding protein [Oceanotoga sp.]MDO7976928.1 ABC transporter ATP-binding protein [Oceanotoga teriensis]PWJ87407.1 putative ABC transport system ATP-binding protein [Oceanotoga teriensis]UYO99601.1 ABC transporter ATP-binding protein [Oceanotoga sp. DSM 15011]